jgi:uncharacterized protein
LIVADTGALIALIDADDRHHRAIRDIFQHNPDAWIVPWATLPEVDYILQRNLGDRAAQLFLADLASGVFRVDWGADGDLDRARELNLRYKELKLGLVDGVVIAIAERHSADAIATLDLRHFGAVKIKGEPRLLPRDL